MGWILALSLVVSIGLAACNPTPTAQPVHPKVVGFPSSPAVDVLSDAAETFERIFQADLELLSIEFTGSVTDVDATAAEVVRTAVVVSTAPTGEASLVQVSDISPPPSSLRAFNTSLRANIAIGDLILEVRVRQNASGAESSSVNTFRPDGTAFSGGFFATARGPEGMQTTMQLPNTVCVDKVLSTYLWGSPAETARGCVRFDRTTDCVLTENNCFGGFFGSCTIKPDVGTPGSETGSCCNGFFNYAWTTGFKSVSVAADGVTLSIEGNIGQSGNGGFTATECM